MTWQMKQSLPYSGSNTPFNDALLTAIATDIRTKGGDTDGGMYNLANVGKLYVNRIFDVAGGQLIGFAHLFDFLTLAQGVTPAHGQYGVSTPGGTVTAGVTTTFTFSVLPDGVSGANVGQPIRIFGGTGAAEVFTITGGTGVQITGVCGNAHSGAWQLMSATGGWQEAVNYAPTGSQYATEIRGIVEATAYAALTISGKAILMRGNGADSHTINRDTSFINDHLVKVIDNALVTLDGMGLQAQSNVPQYASLYNHSGGCIRVYHSQIYHGYIGVLSDSPTGYTYLDDLTYSNGLTDATPLVGVKATSTMTGPNTNTGNVWILRSNIGGGASPGGPPGVQTPLIGIWLDNCDGARVFDTGCGGNLIGILISTQTGYYTSNIWINYVVIDTYFTAGIALTGPASTKAGDIKIINTHIVEYDSGVGVAIWTGYNGSGAVDHMEICHCTLASAGHEAIFFDGTSIVGSKNILVAGNQIFDNNASNAGHSAIKATANSSGLHIVNNVIGNTAGTGHQIWGFAALGDLLDSQIVGNDLHYNQNGPVYFTGAFTGTYNNNKGVEEVTTTSLASANTLNLGASSSAAALWSQYLISGNTVIKTINGGIIGKRYLFRFTNATPAGIDATGNSYVAKTSIVQNQTLEGVYDGYKWSFIGP